jgi:hypothetical protein
MDRSAVQGAAYYVQNIENVKEREPCGPVAVMQEA